MESSNSYPSSTTYRRTYNYIIEDNSINPPTILFKALSRKDILDLHLISQQHKQFYIYTILSKAILTSINIISPTPNYIITTEDIIDSLSPNQKIELSNLIQEVSILSVEDLDKLKLNVDLSLDEKFNTDTWDCELCQYKGLDKMRNCKLRDDYEDIKQDNFSVRVGEEEFTDCPMYLKDRSLINDMFVCYNCYEKGFLPDDGAFMQQTDFFHYATNFVSSAINKQQAKALESS